jgi:hypothetical protein
MQTDGYHLAQINIALMREPLDAPLMAGFVAALEPINAVADQSPGFVWRLQTEGGDATSLRPFDDDRILVNMSVWESLAALGDYVYRSHHAGVLRQRRHWFERMTDVYVALWWVPAGHRPTVQEAKERLEHLQAHGPTSFAFSFREPFPPPGAIERLEAREDDLCPV